MFQPRPHSHKFNGLAESMWTSAVSREHESQIRAERARQTQKAIELQRITNAVRQNKGAVQEKKNEEGDQRFLDQRLAQYDREMAEKRRQLDAQQAKWKQERVQAERLDKARLPDSVNKQLQLELAKARQNNMSVVEIVNKGSTFVESYLAKQAETAVAASKATSSAVGTTALLVANGATCGRLNDEVTHSVSDTCEKGAELVSKLVKNTINVLDIPNSLASAFFFEFTRDLDSPYIRLCLAHLANRVYNDKPDYVAMGTFELFEICHAKIYRIKDTWSDIPRDHELKKNSTRVGPEHKEKICLAIRGSAALATWFQDLGLAVNETAVLSVVNELGRWVKKQGHHIDYVTGHSLGGFLAEACASSGWARGGAAFNSPGGRGVITCFGQDWSRKNQFEVHLCKNDPVSNYRYDRHIAEPKWHDYMKPHPHSMDGMEKTVSKWTCESV